MQKCKMCGIEKPLGDFYYRKESNKYRTECKSCTQERQRYQKFGVCITDYIDMLIKQHGLCAVCNCLLDSSRYTKLAIDHCHKTQKVRGLLCTNCNTAIGLMKDSPERLQAAINYLLKNRDEEIVCSHG